MAETEIRQFISHLAVDARISASTQTVALSAGLKCIDQIQKIIELALRQTYLRKDFVNHRCIYLCRILLADHAS